MLMLQQLSYVWVNSINKISYTFFFSQINNKISYTKFKDLDLTYGKKKNSVLS